MSCQLSRSVIRSIAPSSSEQAFPSTPIAFKVNRPHPDHRHQHTATKLPIVPRFINGIRRGSSRSWGARERGCRIVREFARPVDVHGMDARTDEERAPREPGSASSMVGRSTFIALMLCCLPAQYCIHIQLTVAFARETFIRLFSGPVWSHALSLPTGNHFEIIDWSNNDQITY